jgi:hypothetical protein
MRKKEKNGGNEAPSESGERFERLSDDVEISYCTSPLHWDIIVPLYRFRHAQYILICITV